MATSRSPHPMSSSPPSSSPRHRPQLSPRDLNTFTNLVSSSSYFGADQGRAAADTCDDMRPATIAPTDGRATSSSSSFASAITTPLPPSAYSHSPPAFSAGTPFAEAAATPRASAVSSSSSSSSSSATTARSPPFSAGPSAFSPNSLSTVNQARPDSGSTTPPTFNPPHQGLSPFLDRASLNLSSSSLPMAPSRPFEFNVPPTRKSSGPAGRVETNPRYSALAPAAVVALLAASSPSCLVLDLRAHSAWTHSRVKDSINICVPSTLLRRQTHTVDNLAAALSPADQRRFAAWRTAAHVVVLDADSTSLTEKSGVSSLLAKFVNAGCAGTLAWVKGGYHALRAECHAASLGHLITSGHSQTPSSSTSSSFAGGGGAASGSSGGLAMPGKHARPVLQVKDLPVSAFQVASTSAFTHAGDPANDQPQPTGGGASSSGTGGSGSTGGGGGGGGRPGVGKRRKSAADNAFGISLGMHGGVGQSTNATDFGPGSTTPAAQAQNAQARTATNPFFDNIRQNQEALSLDRSLANLSPVELPEVPDNFLDELPAFLARLVQMEPMQRARVLSRQYYDLEVAERHRLENTLSWHANAQGKDGSHELDDYQKYGISAGVELGSLNRFKNIFPYDHARVRLRSHAPGATDYINASHISFPASSKRWIASQGPLQATYPDFWQMCDQENVGVIIMLTNLHEGGREKCGKYWIPQDIPGWELRVDGGTQDDDDGPRSFFSDVQSSSTDDSASTVRRDIEIRRSGDPPGRRRRIRHIQYRAWPDFDIPAQPADVVALVREVDEAQRAYLNEIGWRDTAEEGEGGERPRPPPIMAHCSAGVGRTGVFIMVSTMLEKLARDRAQRRSGDDAQAMDVDGEEPIRTAEAAEAEAFPPMLARSDSSESKVSMTSEASISLHLSRSHLHATSSPVRTLSTQQPSAFDFSSSMSGAASSLSTRTASSSGRSIDGDERDPLEDDEPVYAGVAGMRDQRMSMVATYRQYVCVLECVLAGLVEELAAERGVAFDGAK